MRKLPYYIQSSADFYKLLAQFHAHIETRKTLAWLQNKSMTTEPLTFQQFVKQLPDYLAFMRKFSKDTQDKNGVVELPTGQVRIAHFSGYISPELTLEICVLAPKLFEKFNKIQSETLKR